jgi:glycosyltransferase involved in cell wall biosynthesis
MRGIPAVPLANRQMKIAIDVRRVADFGVGTYIRNLVRMLARKDRLNEYLLVTGPEPREFDPLPENFERVVFRPRDQSFRNHLQFQFLLDSHGVELLHVPLLRVPFFVGIPYIVTVHDLADYFFPGDDGVRGRYFLDRRALAGAARVLAVSQATGRDVVSQFRLDPSRVEVVYNALDEGLAGKIPETERLRALERYGVSDPYLLYAGSVKAQKNVVRLIEAFAAVKGELGEHPRLAALKLMVIGDEPSNNPDLRRAVVRCRMEKEVRFLGFVPHEVLRVFYEAAEVFVFPSLYEGFGLPPLEAMAQGTPVVASSVSALPEVVGDAAVMVHPENVYDIARGINRVLLEPGVRESLCARSREQVKRFSWERSTERVLEIYREVKAG